MRLVSATFITSAVTPEQYAKGDLSEVALVGRSNVGKSSLLNTLVGQKGLAKVGQTPGKTRLINFFLIELEGRPAFRIVDLPGYGFAKVSKAAREAWGQSIEAYLTGRPQLKAVCLLVDSRHSPSADDLTMAAWLREMGMPACVVATKADKLSRRELVSQLSSIRASLALGDIAPMVAYSAHTGTGRDELLRTLADLAR